jgi:hypothetical protein
VKIGRNDACSCGSGLKYKQCCEKRLDKKTRTPMILGLALAALIAGGITMAFMTPPDMSDAQAPPGKVWNEAHGHFHDAVAQNPGASQPTGAPPPGKIWDDEHGHWHDIDGSETSAAQPDGEPPPGKVWNEEHGHYHDLP